jgi:PAS domain S-box-containing protein
MLAVAAASGVWVYLKTSNVIGAVTAGGSGAAIALVAMHTHDRFRASWARQQATCTSDWEKLEAELRAQLSEQGRRGKELSADREQLVAQIAALTHSNDGLKDELDRRKKAEKILSLQRQDLARSKDVLELHVQASAQELQKFQRRHELILNSAGEGVCGLNGEGKIMFVNPAAARIVGGKVEKLIGRPITELFPGIQPCNPADANTASGIRPAETTVNRRDGSSFVLEYFRSPIREGERLVGEVLMFQDITERKRTETALANKAAELTRSNAELEQFAFVASHDLQEPLRKIQAFGDRLKSKCDSINLGEGQEYLARMQNAAARMRTLIDDLLTFSRVISRTEPFAQVDLNRVVREVLGDLEIRIEKSAATVNLQELPTIEADAMQMRQLFQNLIGNALKFHEPGAKPVVQISGKIIKGLTEGSETSQVRRRAVAGDKGEFEQFCELTVQDNGIGFEEKYLDRIFAVFQRLHGRQEYEGTGIGLAVCRRIVERHHGTITAKSKPREGATFYITLPLRRPLTVIPEV